MDNHLRRINVLSNQLIETNSTSAATVAITADKYKCETLLIQVKDNIALITFNRPKVYNSISLEMSQDLLNTLKKMETDDDIKVIVLTGNEKAFASGADIKGLSTKDMRYMMDRGHLIDNILKVKYIEKPIIAAVNGFALGGGCELAMICDIVVAGNNAKFGQPEVKIGTIPGAGGTQRLLRAVGKSKAMEMILTGNTINSQEALNFGLVSCVVENPVQEAMKMAKVISSYSPIVIKLAKEAINHAEESTLESGLNFERKSFHSTFALKDRSEGMNSFMKKQKPNWENK